MVTENTPSMMSIMPKWIPVPAPRPQKRRFDNDTDHNTDHADHNNTDHCKEKDRHDKTDDDDDDEKDHQKDHHDEKERHDEKEPEKNTSVKIYSVGLEMLKIDASTPFDMKLQHNIRHKLNEHYTFLHFPKKLFFIDCRPLEVPPTPGHGGEHVEFLQGIVKHASFPEWLANLKIKFNKFTEKRRKSLVSVLCFDKYGVFESIGITRILHHVWSTIGIGTLFPHNLSISATLK